MGVYDTLRFKCPSCGEVTSEQSKAGDCCLNYFTLKDAPLVVIADIHDDGEKDKLFCEKCNVQLRLVVRFHVEVQIKDDEFVSKVMRTV